MDIIRRARPNAYIEIADAILKYLDSVEGKSSKDDYPEELRKQGFDYFDTSTLINTLIEHLRLIDYANNSKHWIMLTPEGNKAAKIGIKKYLDEIEQEKQLDKDAKKASIEGVEKANKNSMLAITIAIIVPLLIAVIQIYFDNRKNSIPNGNNNSSVRPEINHSQLPLNFADTLFIEKLKNSLKHDTVFLEDIKDFVLKND